MDPRHTMRWMMTLAVTAALVGLAPLALAKGSKDRRDRDDRHDHHHDGYGDSYDRWDDPFDDDGELWVDRDDLRDDSRDYRKLVKLVERWEDAVRHGDRYAERETDERLERWLDQEVEEALIEVRLARDEYLRARYEARNGSRYHSCSHSGCTHCSHSRDVRDDRRDMRDDKGDLRTARRFYRELNAIAGDLEYMQWRFDRREASRRDYRAKAQLLDELLSIAAAELTEDREELREDVAEVWEDSGRSSKRRR